MNRLEETSREHELGRLRTRLVSIVSHEFANALSVIECGLPFLEDGGAGRDRRQAYRALENNVRSLHETAQTLLNLARMDSGPLSLAMRRADLGAVLKGALGGLETIYRRKGIDASLELPAAPLHVAAHPESLSVVLASLLGAAVRYTPPKGRIVAGVRRDSLRAGRAVLYIQDSGIGVSRRERKEVVETFTKNILTAHGSRLRIKSGRRGSHVFFALPLWTEPPKAK